MTAAATKIPDVVWERHETEIRSFFPPQGGKRVKLKDLMEQMEKRGLHASIPQWKVRLDKWGLTKKRDLKRKAYAPDANDPLDTGRGTTLRRGDQTLFERFRRTQQTSGISFTPSQWTKRFATADFQGQLSNIPESAQALFDQMGLLQPDLSSFGSSTRIMTEALFLLQRLKTLMKQTDGNCFKEHLRHLDILKQNASISMRQDGPAFLRIAAFFLHMNSTTSDSRLGILPIMVGCMHEVCEKQLGYEHQVTTMLRSLGLSAIIGGNSVPVVSPEEWRALRSAQTIALLRWLTKNYERYPSRRRHRRVFPSIIDVLFICSMPGLRVNDLTWQKLFGKETESTLAKASREIGDVFEAPNQMEKSLQMNQSREPKQPEALLEASLTLQSDEDKKGWIHLGRKLASAPFDIDESIRSIISEQICAVEEHEFPGYDLLGRDFSTILGESNFIYHEKALRTEVRSYRSIMTRSCWKDTQVKGDLILYQKDGGYNNSYAT